MRDDRGIYKKKQILARMGAAVLLLLFLTVGVFWQSGQAKAAGADIQITSKRQTVQVGDTVYVVIKISSSTEMSGFEGFFSYDNKLLKFETGGSVVYGNDNEFQISDIDRETKSKVLKYSIKFTARKAGTTSIDLSKPYHAYGESTSDKLSVSYNALALVINKKGTQTTAPAVQQTPTVTAKPSDAPQAPPKEQPQDTKEPAPSDAPKNEPDKDQPGLSSLTVKGVSLSPAFETEVYRYSGRIGTYDTKLDITWTTKNPQDKVTVKGNKNLELGKNGIKIIVQNAAGAKVVYRLTIKIEEPKASAAPSETGTRAVAKGKTITLYGTDAIQIKTPKESDIPEGFGKTELEIDGQVVEAYSLESETEHTYVLVYGSADGTDQFYLYDREKDRLYPYDAVKAWYRSGDAGIVSEEQSALQISNKRLKYIVGILIAVSALLLLGILSLYMKMKGIDPDEIE